MYTYIHISIYTYCRRNIFIYLYIYSLKMSKNFSENVMGSFNNLFSIKSLSLF